MLYNEPTIKNGKMTNTRSAYNPSREVKERLASIMKDYQIAQDIMDRPFEEFGFDQEGNQYSIIQRLNYNQKKFNLYRAPKSKDPDRAWHSNALKPVIRNKVIAIVAHVTSQTLYPDIIAQNDDSIEDKDMAVVMKDTVLWACEQSKYEDMFIDLVQEMCVNPAIILFQDYADVKRKIKVDGTMQEIVDEVYSGFIASIVPPDELFISNIYEPEIQKQNFLIRRKIIDYQTAQRKYGDSKDFQFVQAGSTIFFDETQDLFYEDHDEEMEERLVSEIVYFNRHNDLELTIVGGVMISDPNEPMRRQDKLYPFAKSVYETFNSRFFYGMALVQKLEPDEDLINTLYKMTIDGTYLQMMPSVSVYGESNVSSPDFSPRSINVFSDPNTKVEPLNIGGNLTAGFNTLQLVENSMAETSKQDYQPKSDTTAREIAYMEEQTKIMLGRTGKMVSKLVRDFGQLLVGSIVQYLPIAQLGEVTGDSTRLKFPALFLADREDEDGKSVTKKIEFTEELPEAESEDRLHEIEEKLSFELLDMETKLKMSITKVRPSVFRKMKYMVKVQPSFLSQSTKFAKSMMLFDRLINNPLIKQDKLLKDTVLKELKPGFESEYLADAPSSAALEAQKAEAQPPVLNNAAFQV